MERCRQGERERGNRENDMMHELTNKEDLQKRTSLLGRKRKYSWVRILGKINIWTDMEGGCKQGKEAGEKRMLTVFLRRMIEDKIWN